MKLSVKDRNFRMVVDGADDRAVKDWRERLSQAILDEVQEFIQEVLVEMRRLKPGESRQLSSRPIEVTITSAADESATKVAVEIPSEGGICK